MSYCLNCGASLSAGAKFCPRCGATVTPPGPQAVVSQPAHYTAASDKPSKKAVKRQTGGIVAIIASGLAVIILFQLVIGPLIAGRPLLGGSIALGDPSGISLAYTAAELAGAPVQSATVSPQACVADLDSVTVNFEAWNLDGEDEVVVRTLPEKSDAAGGVSIRGYDLSLASGRSEFYTSAIITIPRTAGEDEDGSVMLYDEQTGAWEYIGHELTEDGKSYIVYMPHFSTIAEKKVKKYIGTENDIRSTTGDLDSQGSLYQYMSFTAPDGSAIPLVERHVYMSDTNFRKLFHSVDTDEVYRLLTLAKIPSQDAVAFALGTLTNTHSLAGGALLLSKVDAVLSSVGKIRLEGCMAGFGSLLTVGRILYQANKGGSFAAILLENKYNIIEGVLGALSYGASYVGAAAAATAF